MKTAALHQSYPPPSRRVPVIRVEEMLSEKGGKTCSVDPSATVYDAIEMMADERVGALLVMVDGVLKGIVSERDYARKVILDGRASSDTLVYEIMTSYVVTASPEMEARECLALMTDNDIRHLPVLNSSEEVVGMLSVRDVASVIMLQQNRLIEQLEAR